jgi:hypothetical protein
MAPAPRAEIGQRQPDGPAGPAAGSARRRLLLCWLVRRKRSPITLGADRAPGSR